MHFSNLWCFLFTIFSPTCFGWCYGHLKGNVLITRIQLWLI